jgi:hypothetical protein
MTNSELDAICDPLSFIIKYITDADLRTEQYMYGRPYSVSAADGNVTFEVYEKENVINLVDDINVGRVGGISDDMGILHFAVTKGERLLFIFSCEYEDSSYGEPWIQPIKASKISLGLKTKEIVVLS